MEWLFGQSGSAVLAVSPLSVLPTPSLLLGGREQHEKPKQALMPCKQCSVIPKTFMFINTAVVTNPNHSTIWIAVKKVHSVAARPGTAVEVEDYQRRR